MVIIIVVLGFAVSIRYIAVLGFQQGWDWETEQVFAPPSFNPLYRGTWFPTCNLSYMERLMPLVSIRYIAVLGFQRRFFLNSSTLRLERVSIRYIAVLGFQRNLD